MGYRTYVLVLFMSVLINLLFLYNHLYGKDLELSWSRGAAIEAEQVASISCSEHGRAYVDGVTFDGEPICECNSCYGGKDCSQSISDCPADADSGDPLFLEPFWMQNAADSAVVVAGWHRMSYIFGGLSTVSEELEKHIRQLHAVVGNAVTEERFILFGSGSTQLLNAAILALSPQDSPTPASVVASAPFYPVYKMQTDFYKSREFNWKGDTSLWKNKTRLPGNFIEFVTSPNNPDGRLTKRVLQSPSSKTIYDHAYYWPHFSAIPSAADEDLMIFTLSKLTGHAGSRFGWALIKDKNVYNRMRTFVTLTSMTVSHDTQLRVLKLLKVALKNRGRHLFDFGATTMREKWKRISKSFSSSKRFSLQKLEPLYCTYFQKATGPSPAYAWVKCDREEDSDCSAVLKKEGIIGRGGATFLYDTRSVRLSLIKTQDDFELLLQRIDALVAKEADIAFL